MTSFRLRSNVCGLNAAISEKLTFFSLNLPNVCRGVSVFQVCYQQTPTIQVNGAFSFCSSIVGRLNSSLRWFLSSWNNFQKPKPVPSALLWRITCLFVVSCDINCCFWWFSFDAAPICLSTLHRTRQYFLWNQCFWGGRSQGGDMKIDPHGLCHSK